MPDLAKVIRTWEHILKNDASAGLLSDGMKDLIKETLKCLKK